MPFYALKHYRDNKQTHSRETQVLGLVESDTLEEAKIKAEELVGELMTLRASSVYPDLPYATFSFGCEPVLPVNSVSNVLQANAAFFEKSGPWYTALKDASDGE